MRLSRRPSPGTALGAVALFVALGGTALAATGQIVNVADPSNAAHVAHVDATGHLQVAGPVSGTVTSQQAPPSNLVHIAALQVRNFACVVIATPPAGKALIVQQIRLNVFQAPASGDRILIYANSTCADSGIVSIVSEPAVGQLTVPFAAGTPIPAGSGVSVIVSGTFQVEAFTDGYVVPGAQVPPTAATVTTQGAVPAR
jgi:hypothetical protein